MRRILLLVLIMLLFTACTNANSVTMENGTTVTVPDGWVAQENGDVLLLATDQALLDELVENGNLQQIEPGQMLMSVQLSPTENTDILSEVFIAQLRAVAPEGFVIIPMEINGKQAATISGDSEADDEVNSPYTSVSLVINDVENETGIMIVGAGAVGELEAIHSMIQTIGNSVSVPAGE